MFDLNPTDILLIVFVVFLILIIIATNVKRGEVMHPAMAALATAIILIVLYFVDEVYLP